MSDPSKPLTMSETTEKEIRNWDEITGPYAHQTAQIDRRTLLAELDATRAKLAEVERERDDALHRWDELNNGEYAEACEAKQAARAENVKLREALGRAMQYGIELGTADPEWVREARAVLSLSPVSPSGESGQPRASVRLPGEAAQGGGA